MDSIERERTTIEWHQGCQEFTERIMKRSLIISSLLGGGLAYVQTPDGIMQPGEFLLGGSTVIGVASLTAAAVLNIASRFTERSSHRILDGNSKKVL